MVILRVVGEHGIDEADFTCGRVDVVEEELAMVPDLVVLEVSEGDFVEPSQLGAERRV